ncbi:probable indole-3-acetic acid-amido synthetase GH3.9 isoform X1 [Lingula anatina]|uniref:Probable indole-3-acetic acid-amido synthetase GH3.9 isoform X1 n=1 Tax=Lingula anatina TaxID=7574 RepID=A0A1S3JSM0_LINAN|nr:probable indole-3-acetic acid-amido synthetase GH3.9 isoform X1 [Lingula anatina]XP_013413039.1 probable indole-3-acetic acid-amido synthetase GH3.9 isoform X3 [Lingula anatina]XP_013413040.1 probable indole-3-acetic acid-amido synthetase GH3.9 isoform X2 [Lingula anatina]XP_013413041.1 probable indole-3-acetic acid-amido synthetase GH3.9 isoform X1 [Lingula anatina]XP_013413042.1 probable indole-3-acetic acid-amido synthetase GH3.9 isoform X1 [Lingula anatina]XP_013413043.1 probable indole|eukprot:XP_013413038.1 probable indole-3-acetic acid-amido synthetase GH3.9 isoform X1 [Lingula anatina]
MLSIGTKFLVVSQVFTAVILYQVINLYQNWRDTSAWQAVFRGLVVFLTGAGGLVTYDIYRKRPAKSHTWRTVLLQYTLTQISRVFAYFSLRNFETASKNISKMQEDALMFYIRTLENTEFGKKHNYSQMRTREDFLKLHPVLSYADLKPYIDKTVAGEKNQITPFDPFYIAFTSGTTGKNKAFVYSKEMFAKPSKMFKSLLFSTVSFKRAGLWDHLKRFHEVRIGVKTDFTDSGVKTGPIAGLYGFFPSYLVSPRVVYDVTTENESHYLHVLFALKDPGIGAFNFSFPSVATRFCQTLEHQWPQLCDDIEHGTLNTDLDIPEDIREKLQTDMRADPQRAVEVRRIIKQGFDGIVRRLWPECNAALMLCSGSLLLEAEGLKKHYMKDVPFCNPAHAATEGLFGFCDPADNGQTRFIMTASLNHFDFIPLEETDKPSPRVVPIEEVQIGQCYELVVTTAVVMRYRQGDVVKIVDFHNQVPVYEFQYRLGQMLNLFWEKMTEGAFVHALRGAANRIDVDIAEYTATENVNFEAIAEPLQNGRHYVLFMELSENSNKEQTRMTSQQKQMFEDVLYEEHEVYNMLRDNGNILPMKVIQVKTGAFNALRDAAVESNPRASRFQYKTPRVLRAPDRLRVLWDSRLS